MPGTADGAPTLLLLHGTGGNEDDLLPLGRQLWPGASLLSPRGPVLEHGLPRFFRRFAEGVFDLEDVARRAQELIAFVRGAAEAYGFSLDAVCAVGYSNGANIAASAMLLQPGAFRRAVLWHAQVIVEPDPLPDLAGGEVLITAGRRDPIVPPPEAERLRALLASCGAEVQLTWLDGGHALAQEDIEAARRWLQDAAGTGRD